MSLGYKRTQSIATIDPTETPNVTVKIQFSVWRTFKHHIPRFLTTILIDAILPLFLYLVLQKYIKPVYALLAASSPPLIMVIVKAIWFWTFDALGFLIFFTFFLTGIVAIVTRNPIIILLEKSLMTGFLSIFFGLTLLPCHLCFRRYRFRPLAYYFYQDLVPTTADDLGLPRDLFVDHHHQGNNYAQMTEGEEENPRLTTKEEMLKVYEWLYNNCSSFRISCYTVTSIWSMGFLSEFLARIILILVCTSIKKVVIYGHMILTSITILLILLTVICITAERRHTLAFIERWRSEHLHPRPPTRKRSIVDVIVVSADSNCVLTVDT